MKKHAFLCVYILIELYNIYAFMHLSAAIPGDWSPDTRRNSTGLTDFCRQFLARDGGIGPLLHFRGKVHWERPGRGICNMAAILKMKDPDRRDWVYLSNRPQVSMGYIKNSHHLARKYLYVICRLGGPYSEKLWPRSWKCCQRPQAEGSIFKPEVTAFHYTDRP